MYVNFNRKTQDPNSVGLKNQVQIQPQLSREVKLKYEYNEYYYDIYEMRFLDSVARILY